MPLPKHRLMAIVAGIALGSIVAVSFRTYRLAQMGPTSPAQIAKLDDEDWDDDDDPWDRVHVKKEDPGRRNDLASLVKSARAEPKWLTEFEYTNQAGETVTSESLKGHPYVVCFFFTTCKGSCPRQTSQMQLLHNKYKGTDLRFVSITVDPEIDTPEVLSEYAKKFGADPARWHFLSGPLKYTERVGMEKYFLDGVEERGHPDRFVLVNAEGDPVGSYVWLDVEERAQLTDHIDEILAKK